MELSKNKKLLLVAISAFLVMIISTVSYAYFTASVAGNNSAQATVIQTGHMEVTYAEGNVIGTSSNMLPGNYIEKSFTVKNTGTVDTAYSIYLNDVENTFVTKSDLVYELITEDGRVVAQTTCPDSNSKIATDINLPVNTTHHYTLRITFKETGLNQDDNKGKKFKSKIGLVEEEVTYAYTILSGDLNTVGSEVKIADEEFYVIGQEDSTHVKLLSKWNLKVGNIYSNNNSSHSKIGEYSSSDTGYGLQSSDVKGYVDGASSYNGTVAFSSTNYWSSTVSTYPAWVYTNEKTNGTYKASIAEYVDNYVTYLTQQGVSVTGRLIKYEELVTLGCNSSTYYCDSNDGGTAPAWVYQTSYWSGSAGNDNFLWGVCSDGYFNDFMYNDDNFGVRPVIILEK